MSNQLSQQAVDIEKRWTAVKCVLLVSSFIILTVAYYYSFRRFPRTSDDASIFLAGDDMSKGNWRLKGWWLPEDNCSTAEILFYASLVKCLGFTPYIMFYLPAMLWAAVGLLSVVLAQGGLTGRKRVSAIAAVATPILLPIIRGNGRLDLISHAPEHVGTIAYVLMCFLFLKKHMSWQGARSASTLIACTFIMLLAVVADPLAIFVGAIPVIAVTAFSTLHGRISIPHLIVLILTVLAVVVGKLLVFVNSVTGGFELIRLQMRFVPFSELGRNVAWTLQYLFTLFGCDFFGKDLFASPANGLALSLIRLPLLAMLVVALIQVGKRCFETGKLTDREWPLLEGEYLEALLAVAFTTNILAAVFSTQIVDAASIRYLVPALVFGAILIARTQSEHRWLETFFYLALMASLAFSGVSYARNPRGAVLVSKEIKALSTWLLSNNLSDGFGPYWSSAIVTAATRNRVKIKALTSDGGGKIKPFQWQASKSCYQFRAASDTSAIFVLVDQQEGYYDEADVIRTLGEPREKHQVGSYIVNVYDPADGRLRSLYLSPTEYSLEASSG